MNVVCSDDFKVKFGSDFEKAWNDTALFLDAMIHDFYDKVFFTKDINKLRGGFACALEIIIQQQARDNGRKTSRESDKPFAVRCECFKVGAWPVIKTFGVCF